MGHHVHRADAQHGAVHVVAVEHAVHIVRLVLLIEEDFLLAVCFQVLARRHQKAGCAARWVADDFVRARCHHVHHHADDMARCAELPVDSRRRQLAQQIFVYVAAGVRALQVRHLLVDDIHRADDFVQHQRRRHLENRVAHVLRVRAVLVAVQPLDEREHKLLHHAVHLSRREIAENAPFKLRAVDGAVANLHAALEDARVRQPQHRAFLRLDVVAVIQIVDEHQVRHLLNHVQRVRQPARPEDFPQPVNLVLQFPRNHAVRSFLYADTDSTRRPQNLLS